MSDGDDTRVAERRPRKTVTGTVTSDKMQKTRTVSVVRLEPHPQYGKYVRKRTTYKVHDPQELSHEGDIVIIAESRPRSKTKRWRLVDIVEKSRLPGAADVVSEGGESS